MILELAYGHGLLRAELSDHAEVSESRGPLNAPTLAEDEIVARAVERPVASLPLSELAREARRVSILISGMDRVAGARAYLPVVLSHLLDAGVPSEGIEIVCATGTHARHSPEDVRELVGETVASRIRFRAHDCDRLDGFVDLGRTSFGTPVRVDRGVVEADLRILTGRITHHYFAGFSGGRKSILPGVSSRETILANHRRVLEFDVGCRVHPRVWGGSLVGNPVHEDMVEAARKTGPCFVVNTLLDGHHRLTHAFAGDLEEAHLAGSAEVDRLAFEEVDTPARIVIASAGGYPYDVNLIQAVKTLFNHRESLAQGGVFILVAHAAGGILQGMKEWMSWADRAALGAAIESSYNLAAHNSLMLRDLLERATVVLVSALPPEEVLSLRLVPRSSLEDAVFFAQRLVGQDAHIRVIHHGNVTQSGRRRGLIRSAGRERRAS